MPKQILQLKMKCVANNQRVNNGNVLFAVDVKGEGDNATAREIMNFQTQDRAKLKAIEVDSTYIITIEK